MSDALRTALDEILALPENWNSYNARRVSPEAADLAEKFGRVMLALGVPMPNVQPSPDGSVVLVWNTPEVEIEFEVTPEGRVVVLVDDLRTGWEWEGIGGTRGE